MLASARIVLAAVTVFASTLGAAATEREWYRDEAAGRLVYGTPGSGDLVLTIACGEAGTVAFGTRVEDRPGFAAGGTARVVYAIDGKEAFAFDARLVGEAAIDGAWDAVFTLPAENDFIEAIYDGAAPFSRTPNGGYVYPWNLYGLYPALVESCG